MSRGKASHFETLESAQSYQYHSLLDGNSIRLLELLPGQGRDPIRTSLHETPLGQDAIYEALSYEWGMSYTSYLHNWQATDLTLTVEVGVRRWIDCDGSPMFIKKGLHTILQELRLTNAPRMLWVDEICINQEDSVERTMQLMRMKQIYEIARVVLCWIGDQTTETRSAFQIIQYLAEAYRKRRAEHWDKESSMLSGRVQVDREIIEEIRGPSSSALKNIFTRSYFGRIWIVQEIVLSQSAKIVCGQYELPWPDLYHACAVVVALGIFGDIDPVEETEPRPIPMRWTWKRILGIGAVWQVPQESRTLDFCVRQFLDHGVSDQADRVYGMLGMVHPQSVWGKNFPIQPHDRKTTQEVYQECCEWSIMDGKSLSILDLCDSPSTNLISGLPTWVPDLAKGPQKCSQVRLKSQISPLTMFHSEFEVSLDGKFLKTKALILDSIVFARSPCTNAGRHLLLMEQFHLFSLAVDPYPTGCTKLEAVWRTFISNLIISHEGNKFPVPSEYGGHFSHLMAREFLFKLGLPEKITGREKDLRDLEKRSEFFTLERMFPNEVGNNVSILALMVKQPFVRQLYEKVRQGDGQLYLEQVCNRDTLCDGNEGRQFFVTEKGFMGFGPRCPPASCVVDGDVIFPTGSGVRKGNVVTVLAGSDKLWILRSHANGVYAIVGDSYVYGLSGGECIGVGDISRMETIQIE